VYEVDVVGGGALLKKFRTWSESSDYSELTEIRLKVREVREDESV
jgi:hypothetical protein